MTNIIPKVDENAQITTVPLNNSARENMSDVNALGEIKF